MTIVAVIAALLFLTVVNLMLTYDYDTDIIYSKEEDDEDL